MRQVGKWRKEQKNGMQMKRNSFKISDRDAGKDTIERQSG